MLFVCVFQKATASELEMTQDQIDQLAIVVGKLQQVNEVHLFQATAKVVVPPINEHVVSASNAGLIDRVYVSVGENVEQGQILASLKSPDLLKLQQQHLTSLNALQLSKIDYKRDKKLFEQGVISSRRWSLTKNRYQIALSKYQETRQLLEVNGFSADVMKKLEVDRKINNVLDIVSPADGIVRERDVFPGQRVETLVALFKVIKLTSLLLDITVPQQYLSSIRLQDEVLVEGKPVKADIQLIGHYVDDHSQMALVRAKVKEGYDQLRLGQTLKVNFVRKPDSTIFKVPTSGVAVLENKSYLFKKTDVGFKPIVVTEMARSGKNVIISTKLNQNDLIVLKGSVSLKTRYLNQLEEE